MNIALNKVSGRHPAAAAGTPNAVRSVSLTVTSGEHVAIIGPSGAGKTTLLHLMACALAPCAEPDTALVGSILLDGTNPWDIARSALQRLRGDLFLAPQVPPLPPRQRVVNAVLAGKLPHESLLRSLSRLLYPQDLASAHAALQQFDLSEKLFDRVDRLSGGERQRVLLARALAVEAEVLLMDEPLANLDPPHQTDWLLMVKGLVAGGKTVVSVLHEISFALQADEMVVMDAGRVTHQGRCDDALTHRALEAVFDQRIAVHHLANQWVALPKT